MSKVAVGQELWIMLSPNFYGVRKIPATVAKIGTKYVYVQPHDDTYTREVRLERATLTDSPHGHRMWTGYLTEEAVDAAFERGIPLRRLTREFFHKRGQDELSDDFVELTNKLLAVLDQHNKEKM
jgi:hypothetical protein